MNPLSFLGVAQAMAALSKDPSTQVGAVCVDRDNTILSVGFNGFPRGVTDDPARYAHRPTKYAFIAHAEANAIAQAARVGARLLGASLILTELHPCSECAKLIIQAGIERVYAPISDNPRWSEDAAVAAAMFMEAGVKVIRFNHLAPKSC